MFIVGLYLIYAIFKYTYEINSQPNPPVSVTVISNFPFCSCDVTNGLAWNAVGAMITLGAIVTVVGYAKLRLVTRAGG